MSLYFFNFKAHYGDLHYYREFVKDIIHKTEYEEYYLLQHLPEKVLSDIKALKFDKLNDNCFVNETVYQINDDLYINIHPGREIEERNLLTTDEEKIFKGLTLDYYYLIFSKIYTKLNILISNTQNYIPEIDYSCFDLTNINNYLENNNRHKVLISNGDCYTFQAPNTINFTHIVEKLSDIFIDVDFILTDKLNISKNNVLFTDDIIKNELPDLNEISYLSTYCDFIVGKGSGPYCFTITKDNVYNKNKNYIFLTTNYLDGIYTNFNNCNKLWINNFDDDNIFELIKNEIDKKTKILNTKKYINNISVTRNDNRINFISEYRLYNISIRTSIDNNGDGKYSPAYSPFFDIVAKDCSYFFIMDRALNEKSEIKLEFYYLQELLHQIII